MMRAAIASDDTKSSLISIAEGWNVYIKEYSASAGGKCVSLLTGAVETIMSSAKMVSLQKHHISLRYAALRQ